jgi:2-dehydropantoate 2-reductase
MRILVIGAGAVGGYFGARLTAAGRDVTFLVREARARQLAANGLHVLSPHDTFSIQPKLLLAADIATPYDVILVSTKAYQLAAAMQDFAPAVGPETAILPLLNGMAHLDTLVARFGEAAVLGGSTRIVADLDAEGCVHSMEDLHDLNFGERDKIVTPRVQRIEAAFRDCGFKSILQPDILAFMWQKWTLLASLGSITCLLRGSIGQVAAAPGGVELARAILHECASIAHDAGYPIPQETLKQISTRFTTPGSPLTASMYRDMSKGAPVEADHILGDLLRRGRSYGLDTPLIQAAYTQLSIYAAARESERGLAGDHS